MKKPGSITIFAALSLALILSFLFVLLEAGRVKGLQTYAVEKSRMGLESVGAEYQRLLWQDYRLLCLDGSYGGTDFSMEYVSGVLKSWIDKNLSVRGPGGNLLSMQLADVETEKYELLTDGEGSVFLHRIAENMKEDLPFEVAQLLYEKYKNGTDEEKKSKMNCVEDAQAAIEDAKKEAGEGDGSSCANETGQTGEGNQNAESTLPQENPLDIVLDIKQNPLLVMVVDINAISGNAVDFSDSLMERKCERGTVDSEKKTGWYEKILAVEYLGRFFSDYTRPAGNHALAYEMEYIIGGKSSDRENLEAVLERLLLLREAANVTHILADSVKRNQAGVIASALAGFTGNPAIIKVVQAGVVAAWAYLESVQDLRALLQGSKIALIKSREQWTVDIEHLSESFQRTSKAQECSNGLSYTEYLKQFLFMSEVKNLSYRAMNLMEQNIQCKQGYQNCRMDYMISRMDYSLHYAAKPFFAEFVTIGGKKMEQIKMVCRASFSYERR